MTFVNRLLYIHCLFAAKHGGNLHKALTELEHQLVASGDVNAHTRLKIINERATLFRITADAMIHVCCFLFNNLCVCVNDNLYEYVCVQLFFAILIIDL
jgi:hypothetical protein